MPAGILYFSMLEQMIKADKRMEQEAIEEKIRANFKMKGLILADVKVVKLHDKNLDKGSSTMVPAYIDKEGNLSDKKTSGVTKGVGGHGTFDLAGRSLVGSLPVPVYNVQEEGRVVVNITVSPNGRVVNTSINSRTNTSSKALRDAALKAARQAVFNKASAVNNQMGTITYYFKLK